MGRGDRGVACSLPVSRPSSVPPPVALVAGPEQFLSERAVEAVLARARQADPDVEVTRLVAAETSPSELAEALSPSLFAASRVAVLDGIDACSDDLGAELQRLADTLPAGAVLVLVHPGGNKGKRLLDSLRKREVDIDSLAEDFSKAMTADYVIGLSQTKEETTMTEKGRGTGKMRAFIAKNRNEFQCGALA